MKMRGVLYKTKSLDGTKPNTNPKTNPNPNTNPNRFLAPTLLTDETRRTINDRVTVTITLLDACFPHHKWLPGTKLADFRGAVLRYQPSWRHLLTE